MDSNHKEKTYWAKSSPPQTIEEHTAKALMVYTSFKKQYEKRFEPAFWDLLLFAILYHDCGKVDFAFQKLLDAEIHGRKADRGGSFVYHNYLSPAFLPKPDQMKELGIEERDYAILVKAIYYHHARPEMDDYKALSGYIKKTLQPYAVGFKMEGLSEVQELNTKFVSRIKFNRDHSASDAEFYSMQLDYIRLKGLLNRIDYTASSGGGSERIELDMPLFDSKGRTIAQATAAYMMEKGYERRTVQKYMAQRSDENVIVVAATGSGKTEAALLWINDQKSFYTLPLKVSINAIYDRIIRKIGYETTALLHSDAKRIYRENHEEKQDKDTEILDSPEFQYESAKLLAYPLTICTVDQVLDFVYKYNGGEAAAATLSYSKLVIDEIQMYSPNLVATILLALKMVVDMGGKFAIITATFPPILYELMLKLKIIPEGQPNAQKKLATFHSEYTHRHRISLLEGEKFNFEEIVEMGKYKKVLVLVNKVKHAQQAYEEIKAITGENGQVPGVLHAGFIRKDRKILEENILEFAPNDLKKRTPEPGIWIATQIVEASLDLDFDILYTEMCAIDSLLQRMGRVWRSRLYKGNEPNVFILDNRSGAGSLIDKDIYEYSFDAVRHMNGKLLEESDLQDDKQAMIEMVYGEKAEKSDYYRSILAKVGMLRDLPFYEVGKDEVKKMFRDINSKTVIPEKIYHELEKNGTLARWNQVLSTSIAKEEKSDVRDKIMREKQKVRDEIMDHTLSISHYERDMRNRLISTDEKIYKGSRIFLYYGDYDYEIVDGKPRGRGLIRELKSNMM